jgi:hypothetical protein
MQTTPHRENVIQTARRILIDKLMERNERVSVGAERGGILKIEPSKLQSCLFPLAIVPLLAGNLTSTAADALGSIDQRCLDEGRAR